MHVEARRMVDVDQDGHPPDGRQPAELHREDEFQDDPEEEDRNRDPEQRADQAAVVEQAAVVFRGQEPERDPDERREDRGCDREFDSGREATLDLLGHRPSRRDTRAEVALDDGLQVRDVLDGQRLVEAVLLLDLGDRRFGGPLSEQGFRRAAGQHPDPGEDEDRKAEQDRHEKQEPADDESQHVARRTLACCFIPRSRPTRTTRSSSGWARSRSRSPRRRAPAPSGRTGRPAGTP